MPQTSGASRVARVAESADALDLGSSGETRAGSTPVSRTSYIFFSCNDLRLLTRNLILQPIGPLSDAGAWVAIMSPLGCDQFTTTTIAVICDHYESPVATCTLSATNSYGMTPLATEAASCSRRFG